ncbi:MAG: 3',5'-cyclic-AMP phosphodiesterase [Halioglobus sp.]|nr:3',5'-cyclic-AMP phosphodiesterase [Halioglobus sp.]
MPGNPSVTVTPAGDIVRIVQLTDAHLCREHGGTLLDMDTDHSLGVVIERVRRERQGLDILLGTGDLADGAAPEAYERLDSYFNELHEDNFWLPGNHDDRAAMEAVGGPNRLPGTISAGGWQLVLLDSQVPGEVGGELGARELAHLEACLEEAAIAGQHVLVCLHHQPVNIGCGWLDEQMVADADEFFSLVDDFDCVRGVLWGHVHQEVDTVRNGVRLLASPSTCVQFAPGCEKFKADDKPPGYRWLDLTPDGGIDTGVSRVLDVTFEVDLESGGYL